MRKQFLRQASRALLTVAWLSSAVAPISYAQTNDACRPSSKSGRVIDVLLAVALKQPEKLPEIMHDAASCQAVPQEPVQKPSTTPSPVEAQTEADDPRERLPELPAREVLKYARLLHFKARSGWYNADKLERELLKRKEFGELGLEITRAEKYADLVMEITRKRLTTRFTCTMIEPHSVRVISAITATSLGGEIEPNLAEAIVKEFKAARAAASK